MIKNRVIISLFGSSLFLLFIASIVGVVLIPSNVGPLIIRFDATGDSIDLLGGHGVFIGLLLISVILIAINFVLALEVYYKERFLSYMLSVTSLFITLIFLLAISAIISIN